MKRGLLIVNLGTPDAPEPVAVGRYLKQFLMDKWVIDIPWLFRWFFVNVLIVPKRKVESAHAYEKIWTKRGSPLAFYLKDLEERVQALIPDVRVASAMRYQNPSIAAGLERLRECDEILVFPLYPQYAESSTRSSIEECTRVAGMLGLRVKFVKDYFEHPAFVEAFAQVIGPVLKDAAPDHLLMSFHGLPERHVQRVGGAHCLASASCCDAITPTNRDCYRAQSYATARALALRLGLSPSQYTVSFQSRLGRTPWIKPYTDVKLAEFPSVEGGIRKLAVVCPSFTTDCLETIEEIGLRGADTFRSAGGTEYVAIPCLNAREDWAEAVVKISRDHGL